MANTATRKPTTAAKAANAPPPLEPDTDAGDAAPPEKKKLSLLKVLLLLTVLLGGAGAGAWYFLQDRDQDQEPKAAAKPGAMKVTTAKAFSSTPPVFVALEPFTVNLQFEDASPQYLQVGLSLKVTDAAVTDAIKLRMPEIRNHVLLLLSGKKASEISTLEGKMKLSTELARAIVQPLAGRVPAQGLEGVLFTSFVIQ